MSTIEDIILGGGLHCKRNNVIYLITCKNCLMLVLLLISRVVLEYIKAISKPTKIDVGRESSLMLCVKMIAIFSSFCLFKLLNKFVVMPQTLKKFYGTEKNIGKASYLPRLMAWTVWLTSTVPNVRALGNKFFATNYF